MAIVLGTAVRAIAALTVDADSAYTQECYT